LKKSIIFDLDQTLIDSSVAEIYRSKRDWKSVYPLISSFVMYEGIKETLEHIYKRNIRVCIVTTSPRPYASRVLAHFGIKHSFLIDYFDVSNRKPHPESFLRALTLLDCECCDVISFGDRLIDITAGKSANIKSVACTWGSMEVQLLMTSEADFIIDKPVEIIDVIDKVYSTL